MSFTNVSLVKDMTKDPALDSLCSRLLLRLTCLLSSFKGGTIELGTPFRLKQTVTEMFMAIDAEGLYLTLRDDPL